MLYTVMPEEAVWQGFGAPRRVREVRAGGLTMLVEEMEGGGRRLERVISTDPQDYLHPFLQPGQYL